MSDATNTGLLVLVAINGAMKVLDSHKLFSRVDLKELVRETSKQSEYAINKWGETGNSFQNTAWLTGVFSEWCEECFPIATKHKAAVLVAACGMIINDQDDKLNNTNKKKLLKTLADAVAIMQEFIDANWLNFPALDEAKKAADRLVEVAKDNEGVVFKVIRERKIRVAVRPCTFQQKLKALAQRQQLVTGGLI